MHTAHDFGAIKSITDDDMWLQDCLEGVSTLQRTISPPLLYNHLWKGP